MEKKKLSEWTVDELLEPIQDLWRAGERQKSFLDTIDEKGVKNRDKMVILSNKPQPPANNEEIEEKYLNLLTRIERL